MPLKLSRETEEYHGDFRVDAESWLIDRYSLDTMPYFDVYVYADPEESIEELGFQRSEPKYIVRLLPLLREHCVDEDERLDPSKFEDIFLILHIVSLFYQEDDLEDANDTKYIYIEMCMAICEWLTTQKEVIEYFNQKVIKEEYATESGVLSQRIQFDKKKYLESIWGSMREILRGLLMDTFESVAEDNSFDFDKLDRIAPWKKTRFSDTLIEWFDLIFVSDIESHFRQDLSHGIFSRGFKRYDEWDPRYRLMIYSSLIRQTYALNSQTCFMFNNGIIFRLRELIRLGHLCLQDREILKELDNFWIEDELYGFQMLSQTSSLFLEQNTIEIFHHCSSMERMHNPDVHWNLQSCFQRSILTKACVVLSGNDLDSQVMLQQQSQIFDAEFGDAGSARNIPGRLFDSLQKRARYLKEGIEKMIDNINMDTGLSATKRLKEHESLKTKHISLYKQLGIPTNIPSPTRGRRTEILFYHQNKKVSKLMAEIEYLPTSLNTTMKLFNDSNSVISAPYLVVITLGHVLQFTQCVFSLGNFSDSKVIARFGDEINHIIGVLDKWGFLSATSCLAELRDLFRRDDNFGNPENLDKITRGKVIQIQTKLKEIYDENIRQTLQFPPTIPTSLSPYFAF
tara:strand:+ start:384 stop:2261 length:1878 start_codon:yes stop_codon:yes gene_type:complete